MLLWVARKIESNPYLSLTWLKLELGLSLAKVGVYKSLFVSQIIIVTSKIFFILDTQPENHQTGSHSD